MPIWYNYIQMEKTKRSKVGLFYALVVPLVFVGGAVAGQFVDIPSVSFSTRGPSIANNDDLDYSSVEEAYDVLAASYDGDLDKAVLIEGIKKGLAEATGDPYTEYYTQEESKEFSEQISGSFTGIGAELGKEDNAVVVISPIKGFPAEKAGLKARDIIVRIDDEDVLSYSISEAVKKIRGPKDTDVKLTVVREGERLDFVITRAEIKIPSVEYEVLDGGICQISIGRFSDDTDTIIREAAKVCKSAGATKVLLDLRNNPGGYLDQSVQVASHWVDSGKVIVSEKRGDKVIKQHTARTGQEFKGMETVVLINEGSASASEIVAGALKDYELATLVGQKTYGKGSVQEVGPLGNGTSLKITIARWFTPLDKNIDKEGIEPTEKVEITKEQAEAKVDSQKQKALEILQ
jgi:carboxyl-terminal processing protease